MPIKTRLNDSPSPTLRWVKGVCLISCNPTSVFWGRMAGIFSSTTAIARRGNVPAQNVDLGEENSLSAPAVDLSVTSPVLYHWATYISPAPNHSCNKPFVVQTKIV